MERKRFWGVFMTCSGGKIGRPIALRLIEPTAAEIARYCGVAAP